MRRQGHPTAGVGNQDKRCLRAQFGLSFFGRVSPPRIYDQKKNEQQDLGGWAAAISLVDQALAARLAPMRIND